MDEKLKELIIKQLPEPSKAVQEHPLVAFLEDLLARVEELEDAE